MKFFLSSKTILFNGLTFLAGAIAYGFDHNIFSNPTASAAVGAILVLVNIGLRFLTTTPVTLKK